MSHIFFVATRRLDNLFEPRNFTIFRLLARLSRENEITLFAPEYRPSVLDGPRDEVTRLQSIKFIRIRPSGILSLCFGAIKALMLAIPFQSVLFGNRFNKSIFCSELESVHPDTIIFDYIRALCFIQWSGHSPSTRKLLDMGDMLSARYESLMAIETDNQADYLGYATKYFPRILIPMMGMLRRFVLSHEYVTTKALEDRSAEMVDEVVLVSLPEVSLLKLRTGRQNILHIPYIISGTSSGEPIEPTDRDPNAGYFIGNFAYAPNVIAMDYLLKRFFRVANHCTFKVIGPGVSDDLRKRMSDCPNVRYLGYVDDVFEETKSCGFLVAPVFAGSGVSSKILEAINHGMFVITNPQGSAPIEHLGLESLFVAGDEHEFLDATRRIPDMFESRASIFDRDKTRLDGYGGIEAVGRKWENLLRR